MSNIIRAADLFCGAGGTSSGLYRACHSLGKSVDLLAINHWKIAIETHSANHPGARHICERLEAIRPEDAIKSGHLHLLVASPECTHHSVARGGKPVCDQLRASAWLLLRWLEALRVDNVLIENVQEFRNWGPVGASGRPLKSRKGETYQAFLNALRSFGYSVEDRVLNAADYGDPTSRRRLFIMARRSNRKIKWPDPSHGDSDMFSDLLPYRTAREIIDWDIAGQSIFTRKRPLAPHTLARIAAGLRKFGGVNADPFLVMLYGTNDVRSVDRPCPTVTASGNHIGLCEPFLVQYHNGRDAEKRTYPLQKPIPTLDTSNRYGLCEPFIIPIDHKYADAGSARSLNEPIATITTENRFGICEPFIVKYFGCGENARSVNEPLPTITTNDRFGLVEPGDCQLDIRFRMLQPHELAAAMSFENYKFAGNRGDQVKQIGNAVPVRIAEALCRALLIAA